VVEPSIAAQLADLLGEEHVSELAPKRLPVAQAMRQCPRLGLLPADDQGRAVAVAVLEDGSRVVMPDNCPHDGGLISDGFVEGNRIVCARHGWEFDGHSGRCTHRPELQVPCSVLAEGSGPVDS
jgi:nitrite reductase/ring-hydroxylating ferredoxin subunit